MRAPSIFFAISTFLFGLACRTTVVTPAESAVALHVAPNFDGPFVVSVGADVALFAIPVAADSTKLGGPIAAAWASSDTVIATVNGEGRVHTRCIGTTIISAAANESRRSLRGSRGVSIVTTGPRCA